MDKGLKSYNYTKETALVILFKASEHHKNITHTNTLQLQWHQVVCSGTIFSNGQHSLKIAPSEVYTACLEDSPAKVMYQEVLHGWTDNDRTMVIKNEDSY